MYKTKLPFLIVFNKVDVMAHDFAVRWMTDIEAFDVRNALIPYRISLWMDRPIALSDRRFNPISLGCIEI
jgi:hypothetical protein